MLCLSVNLGCHYVVHLGDYMYYVAHLGGYYVVHLGGRCVVYLGGCCVTAQGDHELSGQEDPSILHAYIAYLPSRIAYKEGNTSSAHMHGGIHVTLPVGCFNGADTMHVSVATCADVKLHVLCRRQ